MFSSFNHSLHIIQNGVMSYMAACHGGHYQKWTLRKAFTEPKYHAKKLIMKVWYAINK